MKLKEDEINERRLLLAKNDELRKEIEAKDQINNMKIQKKLKDRASGQLKECTLKWEENQKNQNDLKERIKVETDKVDLLEKDKIFLTNSLNMASAKLKDLHEANEKAEEEINNLKKEGADLNENVGKTASEVI